jgi:hypothetical protein
MIQPTPRPVAETVTRPSPRPVANTVIRPSPIWTWNPPPPPSRPTADAQVVGPAPISEEFFQGKGKGKGKGLSYDNFIQRAGKGKGKGMGSGSRSGGKGKGKGSRSGTYDDSTWFSQNQQLDTSGIMNPPAAAAIAVTISILLVYLV